jgi:hypothetical protein
MEDLRAMIEVDSCRPSELARVLGFDRAVRPNAEDALSLADLITR